MRLIHKMMVKVETKSKTPYTCVVCLSLCDTAQLFYKKKDEYNTIKKKDIVKFVFVLLRLQFSGKVNILKKRKVLLHCLTICL